MTRILLTGSRAWTDDLAIRVALAPYRHAERPAVLVHGDCRGADRIAAATWRCWRLADEPHPADWATHGRAAGILRNRHMVTLGAVVCLAFIRDDSPGATHCARLATDAGIPTRYYRQVTA